MTEPTRARHGMRGGWCWRCDHVRSLDPDLVRASYDDPAVLETLLDEDVVLHVPGCSWLAGDHHGRTEALRIMERLAAATVEREFEEILVGERHVAVILRVGLSFGEGELVVDCVHLFRLEGPHIREGWILLDRPAAVDEVLGLPHRFGHPVSDPLRSDPADR